MTQPTVCAILLTADRQEMTDRAVRSFLAQDYPNKVLLTLDTGVKPYVKALERDGMASRRLVNEQVKKAGITIGGLRNIAVRFTYGEGVAWYQAVPDILIHFDSDDWSAPTRISDQVKLLVESGKQAVGYREMLFWDSRANALEEARTGTRDIRPGEAWLYSNTDIRYCLATSLCYWRKTWEAKPFPDAMIGSEREWLKGLDMLGVAGSVCQGCHGQRMNHGLGIQPWSEETLLMLATIHGDNTVKNQIVPAASNPDGSPMWRRVPAWDERVREILEAA